MEFYNWLAKQRSRQDRIGAFARALSDVDTERLTRKNSGRRKKDDHKRWADIVVRRNNPNLIVWFNAAWNEFCAAREAQMAV